MSFTDTREEIADALSTVAGVTGYATRPNALSPGDGYALLDGINRGPGLTFEVTWKVLVILSGDEFAAYDQLDTLLPPLLEAINPVAFVDRARPLVVKVSNTDLYAIEITARSE